MVFSILAWHFNIKVSITISEATNVGPTAVAGNYYGTISDGGSTSITLQGSATDIDDSTLSLTWYDSDGNLIHTCSDYTPGGSTCDKVETVYGSTTYTLTALDSFGASHTDTATITITEDNLISDIKQYVKKEQEETINFIKTY